MSPTDDNTCGVCGGQVTLLGGGLCERCAALAEQSRAATTEEPDCDGGIGEPRELAPYLWALAAGRAYRAALTWRSRIDSEIAFLGLPGTVLVAEGVSEDGTTVIEAMTQDRRVGICLGADPSFFIVSRGAEPVSGPLTALDLRSAMRGFCATLALQGAAR